METRWYLLISDSKMTSKRAMLIYSVRVTGTSLGVSSEHKKQKIPDDYERQISIKDRCS